MIGELIWRRDISEEEGNSVVPVASADTPMAEPPKRKRGRPRIHPPKRKLTPEELSKVRSAAGRKGGLSKKKPERPRRTTIFVYGTDKAQFAAFAKSNGKTLLDGMSLLAKRLAKFRKKGDNDESDESVVFLQPEDLSVVKRVMEVRGLSIPLALHLIIEFFRKRVEF